VHGWEGAPSRTGNFRIGVNDPDYSDYWNCDGLIAEGSVTKLRVDNVEAYGCTDGGLDIKAPDAVLTNCVARENKRNFRLWHSGIELVECEGYRPVHPGGTGGAAQIWAGTNGANGGQRIIGGVFDNEDATYPIVENSAVNPVLRGHGDSGPERGGDAGDRRWCDLRRPDQDRLHEGPTGAEGG
jgi:hypothetical protein